MQKIKDLEDKNTTNVLDMEVVGGESPATFWTFCK